MANAETVTPKLLQASYAHEAPYPPSDHLLYEFAITSAGLITGFFGAFPCLFCVPNPFTVIPQGKVGLWRRFGKYIRSVDPGLYFVNPCSENAMAVDIRIQCEDVPRQTVMTKDNVDLQLEACLFWHIVDPYVATFMVEDVRRSLIDRVQTTLRQVIGSRTVQEALEHRESLAHDIEEIISPTAISLGVKIESILIKDLQFSAQLQASLSTAARQKRAGEASIITAKCEGEAKIIIAEAEVQAARLMRECADMLNSKGAMQIRYLDAMKKMSTTGQAKVIYVPAAISALHQALVKNVENKENPFEDPTQKQSKKNA